MRTDVNKIHSSLTEYEDEGESAEEISPLAQLSDSQKKELKQDLLDAELALRNAYDPLESIFFTLEDFVKGDEDRGLALIQELFLISDEFAAEDFLNRLEKFKDQTGGFYQALGNVIRRGTL